MKEYKELEKEFQKVAPSFMKSLGISDNEIKDCINSINDENKIRDQIIEELKKKYSLYIERQDFPVIVYGIDVDDINKIYIKHDCSRWLWVYYGDHVSRSSFDPLEKECLDNICDYIDTILKNKDIKI